LQTQEAITASSARHDIRGLTRRWILRESGDIPAAPTWFAGLDLPPLVQRVLAARGLKDAQEARLFCEPKLTHLHDPALLPNVDVAAMRIIDAIRRNELIAIYGDYDVDGISATAILYHVIKTVQPDARVQTYVPHRLDEGYGLNCEALRLLKSQGADVVITVDCGVTAVKSAATACEIGLDLIITDHHEMAGGNDPTNAQSALPMALAIVHPRVPGSQYPFGELCGAGVAFKLAWRFATLWCNSQRVSESLQKTLVSMLPLVALGTIADVVPLTGENRILTAFGLRLIKQSQLPGLRALIEASGLMDEKIDSEKVGFVLAPRLNACGRMGHAAEAVRLLTEASPHEAMVIARNLADHNQHRQGVERMIFDQACQLAEDAGMVREDRRAIVLAHEGWHPGVVGIVCSRMVERFGRPTVLMQKGRDLTRGSARSIDGYSIHEGLSAASEFLASFGGHAMAAGLTLPSAQIGAFAERLIEHANARIAVDQLIPSLRIDCDAWLGELDESTVQKLHQLSPFGRGNRAPTLRLQRAFVAGSPKQMGSNGKHLSLQLRQENPDASVGGRRFMRAVWWSAGERAADLAPGATVDVVVEPKLNSWNGRVSVEVEICDMRLRPPESRVP
jgi:single-stranded-DNA-specific exonuclease